MHKQSSLFFEGVVAGGLATVCMSLLMLGSKKLGVQGEHPPKRIVEAALSATGDTQPPLQKVLPLAAAVHVGFGMAAGGVFALIQQKFHLKKMPILQGAGYGLLVWAVSYKGWIPALGILPPAERDRPGRVKTMIAAHLVYGAVLAGRLHRKLKDGTITSTTAQNNPARESTLSPQLAKG
jgi:uncharacterized membrane protein YagU involved in acid resistance